MEPRRSGRNKKQTKLFGNPLLYKIAPRFIPEILQQMSETLQSLQEKYSGTVEVSDSVHMFLMAIFFGNINVWTHFLFREGEKCVFVNYMYVL